MNCLAGSVLILFLLVSSAFGQKAAPTPASCAALTTLNLPNTKIIHAEQVEAGKLTPPRKPYDPAEARIYPSLPAFCRVVAQVAPTPDSDIKIEVWMPASGWNGKFRGQGNGGFAGEIDYGGLALAVSLGYASAGTDTGHAAFAGDASWALGHPEKVIDYGYRGIHEMTLQSRAIVQAYYSNAPRRSYFAACSDGGREALMEAQRYPADYDGILAGAPANNWTNLLTTAVHNVQALILDPASYIPASKLPAISSAVLAACDASDGVKDGILNDPRQCHFDPAVMLCKASDSDQCLTAPQVTALKALYAGAYDSAGKQVFPGYLPGSETGGNGWGLWITGPAPGKSLMFVFGIGYFSNMVYEKSDWDYKTFNVDDGLRAAVEKTASALNATNPDLRPFGQRGGKLILYHGWNDPAISALSTVDYYNQMTAATGQKNAQSFVRLFMAPGVQHCAGGPGPDSFGQGGWEPGMGPDDPQHDLYLALEQWVEKDTAPEQVIATKYPREGSASQQKMTRPLCAYPQQAKYKGSGDTSDAANFVCAPGPK